MAIGTATCRNCGSGFRPSPGKKYCSHSCKTDHYSAIKRKGAKELAQAVLDKNSKTAHFRCEQCGSLATRYLSGTNRRKGTRNRFCSQVCRTAFNRTARERRQPPPPRLCPICSTVLPKKAWYCSDGCKSAAQQISASEARRRRRGTCRTCKRQFPFLAGNGPKVFCSTACRRAKKVEQKKKYRRRYGRKWRGICRARSLPYETINRIVVFERDRWTCQICGVKTPRRLLRSASQRSPTLDHRIPISKGGGHLYTNVQCACRRCNTAKSNRVVIGQLPLFSNPAAVVSGGA